MKLKIMVEIATYDSQNITTLDNISSVGFADHYQAVAKTEGLRRMTKEILPSRSAWIKNTVFIGISAYKYIGS